MSGITFRRRWFEDAPERTRDVVTQLRPLASPLAHNQDLDRLLERVGNARYVLLGEASHGTSEFYTWRARITRRLIEEKGFSFVAVEGDWPDCYEVNRYVKLRPAAAETSREVLRNFERWPSWMWANREVQSFIEWLREHNSRLPEDKRVGFHGLDVYSLWESMSAVVDYLTRVDPAAAERAQQAYECFARYERDEQEYARATALVPNSCEDQVICALVELQNRSARLQGRAGDEGREAYFNAEQNALTAKNAELYYRTMVRGGAASWNVRDMHMAETLDRLTDFYGPGAKAVVWAHNSHIGDARFTDSVQEGELNLGQLVRERHEARGVVLVGFSTYQGTVIAGERWGAPLQRVNVPAAPPGSWDEMLHRLGGGENLLLLLADSTAGAGLLEPYGQRAIGVVYRPQHERFGNYVPTVLPMRYDALLFIDSTRALSPIAAPEVHPNEVPETYPSGM